MARLKLKLQLYCGDAIAMGPGKAALLEAIRETGSISAAARRLGMSYRRAWMLVDTMNRCFEQPLVETEAGGGHRAGARITVAGEAALAAFRQLEGRAASAVAGDGLAVLHAAIRETPLAD